MYLSTVYLGGEGDNFHSSEIFTQVLKVLNLLNFKHLKCLTTLSYFIIM